MTTFDTDHLNKLISYFSDELSKLTAKPLTKEEGVSILCGLITVYSNNEICKHIHEEHVSPYGKQGTLWRARYDILRPYTGQGSDMGARFADWFYELDDIAASQRIPSYKKWHKLDIRVLRPWLKCLISILESHCSASGHPPAGNMGPTP